MQISPEQYEAIAREIQSDDSPVGIDAKKTHIIIIHLLRDLSSRLAEMERRIEQLERQ